MGAAPWFNENWVIALVTLMGATATFLGSLLLWRQLIELNRKNRFDILQFAAIKMQHRFGATTPQNSSQPISMPTQRKGIPTGFAHALTILRSVSGQTLNDARFQRPGEVKRTNYEKFYALKNRFRDVVASLPEDTRISRTSVDYVACLCDRIKVVSQLPKDTRRSDMMLIREFVNSVNDVAEMIEEGLIDKRSFFGRYHLAIIREVYIAEPYIYFVNLYGKSGRWGMRVLRAGEIAREFNDINPIHRAPVYYPDDPSFGCIYRSPCGRFLSVTKCIWWMRHSLGLYPSINSRSKVKQNALLRRVAAQLKL